MSLAEIIRELKALKGESPGAIAMKLIGSKPGLAALQDAMKAKSRLDKRLRNARDFVGVPSQSDLDRVDRAIDRVSKRLKELDRQLDDVEHLVDDVESVEKVGEAIDAAKTKPAPPVKPEFRSKVRRSEKPAKDVASLTNVIELLSPAKKKTESAAKPASSRKAKPRKPAPPFANARSMLDINLKR